jgi:hypothetical protein
LQAYVIFNGLEYYPFFQTLNVCIDDIKKSGNPWKKFLGPLLTFLDLFNFFFKSRVTLGKKILGPLLTMTHKILYDVNNLRTWNAAEKISIVHLSKTTIYSH